MRVRRGAVPGGIAAGEIYPLPNWTNAELAEIRREAGELATQERARRGGAGGGGVGAAVPAPAAGAAPSPPSSQVVGPYADGTLKWLSSVAMRCGGQRQQSSPQLWRWCEDLCAVC